MCSYSIKLIIVYGSLNSSFHTNTIEGVWSRIKRTTNKFLGINGAILSKLESKGFMINEYVNGIICSGLFFMEYEHNKLGLNGKKKLLIDYLNNNF